MAWAGCMRRLVLMGLGLAVLAGCAATEGDLAPCPAARVLAEPSELTRFRAGPGRDPTDQLFTAAFLRVTGECNYDGDGGDIDVTLEVTMEILRGPASPDGKAAFGYFVAVAERSPEGGEPAVLNRQSFQVAVDMPPARRGARYQDVLTVTIPRPDGRDVRAFVLYLGFELSREELNYNLRNRGY